MDELNYLTSLYDYYKDLLTEKQRNYFEEYYFENLLMDEIAENNGVSKNAVSKSLIEVKEKLEEYEKILSLNYNKNKIMEILDKESCKKIIDYI
ncbi:MAG: DNA-binding protein [Bacilli bacterium]|nr:DNA-binding protein [Bacilli bacterium]